MDRKELGILYPIVLKEYDKRWPTLFKQEKNRLLSLFGSPLVIEHIGSTAIIGLSAKPTIDILLETPKNLTRSQIINMMEQNGYIHMKEQKRHLMFVKGYTLEGLDEESFHIHIGSKDQEWLWDRLYFRDYLNENQVEAKRYELLKKELAAKYKYDRDGYTDSKSDYIERITEIAKREMQ